MNIFVCVKQVPDTETKITPTGDGNYIETSSIKWVMNPYDEFAVEQALSVKAANSDSTITVVRVGSVRDTESLRTAMAMGADESFLVQTDDILDPYATSKAIKGAIEKSGKTPDLILTGWKAIDDDNVQVPQILAHMMDMPHVSVITAFEQSGDTLTLKREIEGGTTEIYEVNGACVVGCNKGLNTPRYPSLPGLMKAKKKPLTTLSLEDVGVSTSDMKVKYSDFQLPPEKPAGKKFEVDDSNKESIVKEVVSLLRNEAKVI
jgi:electron transfer flavoprotein beta subunit